jgi:hypothetical protein
MVHPSRMPRFTAPATTEAGATQPLLEPRLGRQTTVAVAVAAEPARAEATTTHAAEVNHAAVRIDNADARHALAADPLVSGPLALAEADLAAAGASAAATPTETEATPGAGPPQPWLQLSLPAPRLRSTTRLRPCVWPTRSPSRIDIS